MLFRITTVALFCAALSYAQTIDDVVNNTFDHIQSALDRSNVLVRDSFAQTVQSVSQLVQTTTVSGDVNALIQAANGFEQRFLDSVDRILDVTFNQINNIILKTDLNLFEQVQHTRQLPIFGRVLNVMSQNANLLQNWIREYVSRAKPVFRAFTHQAFRAGRAAHAEALRTGDLTTAEQHFQAALQNGIGGAGKLLETVGQNTIQAVATQRAVQKRWAQFLLNAWHSRNQQ